VTAPRAARVLVVEDEVVIAILAQQVLEEAGLEVVGVAGSEHGALVLAALTHPTHALVDVKLAPGDGRVVARALGAQDCAVVYCTAWVSTVLHDPSAAPGLAMAKPYDPEDIILALHAARRLADGEQGVALPHGMVRVGGDQGAGDRTSARVGAPGPR
jgi:DNA-binding NarL/FixJ family response regulator